MRIKFVSIFVVLCIVFSAMYMPGVSFASGSSQPLPRVDFSASSICSASGLSRNTFYKYSSSSASAEFKVTASTKETKTFDFSANGISTDWSYGNTIVIPMYNKYATGDVVNFVMTDATSGENPFSTNVLYTILLVMNGKKSLRSV